MSSLPIEHIFIEAERQQRERQNYLSHWITLQEQSAPDANSLSPVDEWDDTAPQLVHEMLDYIATESAELDCLNLIYEAEVYAEQENYCKLLQDKLKWVNLQLRVLENEYETMGLRQRWEILQQRIWRFQNYLSHSGVALDMLRRCEAIHNEILTLSCCLQHAQTEPADIETEIESLNEQLAQVHDQIETLAVRGYDMSPLLAAYHSHCEELEMFCELLDA